MIREIRTEKHTKNKLNFINEQRSSVMEPNVFYRFWSFYWGMIFGCLLGWLGVSFKFDFFHKRIEYGNFVEWLFSVLFFFVFFYFTHSIWNEWKGRLKMVACGLQWFFFLSNKEWIDSWIINYAEWQHRLTLLIFTKKCSILFFFCFCFHSMTILIRSCD